MYIGYSANKMTTVSDLPTRLLTPLELERVLSAVSSFRLDPTACTDIDAPIFEALRYYLRHQFADLQVIDHPDIVKALHAPLRRKFLCSLFTPGISDGARAASANTEPLMQATLKAAQAVGVRDAGKPIDELLSMSARRGAEFIYTAPETGAPPPEWYIGRRNIDTLLRKWAPPDLDGLLSEAMDTIEPPIEPLLIRTSRGAVCRTVKLTFDPQNPDPIFMATMEHPPAPGSTHTFHIIDFSIPEALKLRRSPRNVLGLIRQFLLEEPEGYRGLATCSAGLCHSDAFTFSVAIWSESPTVAMAAARGIVNIGAQSSGLSSFEIIQIPTLRAITAYESIDPMHMGLLAPRTIDGKIAKVWLLHLSDPTCHVPAKHVALYLVRLGLQILSCDRNAAGRCVLLRVAEFEIEVEGELKTWIPIETTRRSLWEEISRSDRDANMGLWDTPLPEDLLARIAACKTYAEFRKIHLEMPQSSKSSQNAAPRTDIDTPITTWRAATSDPMSPYMMYRIIKYRGCGEIFRSFMERPLYDWTVTYTNLVPEMAKIMCTYVARQAMDLEWILRVASGKVTQSSVDLVTGYGCGTGPNLQPVNQAAIGVGGPLAALNEKAFAVFTNAALASRTYNTNGSQAEIATGSTSRHNGASSVRVIEVSTSTASHASIRGSAIESALTADSTVNMARTGHAGPEDLPIYL